MPEIVDIIYKTTQIPVRVIPTRKYPEKPHLVCSSDMYKIGRKYICTNESCKFHNDFPKEENTKRTFEKLKIGEQAKETFEIEQIKDCKEFTKDIEILGKQMKPIDKTRIINCHYVLPVTFKDEDCEKYSTLYFGLKNSDYVLPIATGKDNAESIGVLTVEKDFEIPVILLFTMMFTEESHKDNTFDAKSSRLPLSSKRQTEKGRNFINSLDPYDLAEYESHTYKNYELLRAGKEIIEKIKWY